MRGYAWRVVLRLALVAIVIAALGALGTRTLRAQSDAGGHVAAIADGSDAELAGLLEGDIILQTSRSPQSLGIQLATHSRFSHVGLVHREGDRLFVYEAIGPVTLTPLSAFVARGEGHHVTVMRLKDRDARFTPDAVAKMRRAALRFRGRPYDFAFGWSDERIYCSELVYKVYREGLGVEVGRLQRLGDFDLSDPRVKAKLRERYGDRVPVDEVVISPGAIAESGVLEVVVER